MKHFILVTIFVLQSLALQAIDITGSIVSGGVTRSFVLHAPGTAVASNLPVMLVLHGDGGTGSGIKSYSGFDAVANAQNFMAVYPNAYQSGGLWNKYVDNVAGDAGSGNTTAPDDVVFISDLISYLCTNYSINKNKVYACGHSGGAFMCYNLAMQLPSKIAGIAPVAGSLWGDNTYVNNLFSSASYVKVPVYHIHGDADATVSYPDANHSPTAWGEWPFMSFGYYGCGNNTYTSTTNVAGTTTVGAVKQLSFCAGPASATSKEVYLIRIVGGGHGWPNVSGYNPALSIWNFCNQYSINAGAACSTTPVPPLVGSVKGGIASANTSTTIHRSHRFLLGPQGDTIILRGVNYAPYNWGWSSTELNIDEIAKSSANSIRLVWYVNGGGAPVYSNWVALDSALSKCVAKNIIPIVELHDQTCTHDSAALVALSSWWTHPNAINILNKYEGWVIINYANEALGSGAWGWLGGSANSYKNIYKKIIGNLRSAMLTMPIMIDASECGGNETIFTSTTIMDSLQASDPLHNIIFSVHTYWPTPTNTSTVLNNRLNTMKNVSHPIVLGEIANTSDCADVILVDSIMKYSLQKDLGYLIWSWDRDNCATRQLSSNGLYSGLTSNGINLLNAAGYGLSATAVKMLQPNPNVPLSISNFQLYASQKNNAVTFTWDSVGGKYVMLIAKDGVAFDTIAITEHNASVINEATVAGTCIKVRTAQAPFLESNTICFDAKKISVTPTVSAGVFEIAGIEKMPCKLIVLNVIGEKILEETLSTSTINLAKLPNGMYWLLVGDEAARVMVSK